MTSVPVHVALLAASLNLFVLPPAAGAGQGPSATDAVLLPTSRVRAFDAVALEVLQAAITCSPTVARAVSDLQASDLIVGIEAHPFKTNLAGELRVLAASAGVRHVRIRLQTPNAKQDLMWILGHELHHALEVAAAAEVRDAATQRAFYVRAGWEREGGGRFETDGALEAGRLVAREIAGCRAR
jgi:hypothetical protein